MKAFIRDDIIRAMFSLTIVLVGFTAVLAHPLWSSRVKSADQATRILADEVLLVVEGAAGRTTPSVGDAAARECLGTSLAEYASNPGTEPRRYEGTRIAARRIIAGTTPVLQPPDLTSRWLAGAADRLEQAAADPDLSFVERHQLVARAHLARFHADRLIAAVRYNLFRRNLSLAELYAATQLEKRAVGHWQALLSSAPEHPFAAKWAEELRKLEANLHDLESACCPPTKAHLEGPLWQPQGLAP